MRVLRPPAPTILLAAALFRVMASSTSHAADGGGLRDYVVLRGGATYFTDPGVSSQVELENPALEGFQGGALGLNFDRHLGAEIAAEFTETALLQPGTGEKIAEYGLWTLLAQLRVRAPMWRDHLVPYATVGAGIGFGEQNDRNFLNAGGVGNRPAIAVNGTLDTTFVAALSLGVEYFITDNLALGVEAKHFLAAETELEIAGRPTPVHLNTLVGSIGLRIFFDKPEWTAAGTWTATDDDALRAYLVLRAGGAFFTDPDRVPEAEIATPTAFGGGGFGVNVNRYWGVEFAAEGLPGRLEASLMETSLSTPGIGEVVEYSVWTNVVQLRGRYPLMDSRLVPYFIVGGGLGFTEFNDRRVPAGQDGVFGGFESTPVATAGIGIEYFIANSIALGIEAKHVFLFDSEVTVNQRPAKLTIDPVLVNLSLRLLL